MKFFGIGLLLALVSIPSFAGNYKFTAIEAGGVKIWYPPTLTVKKGEKVTLSLVSKIPGAVKTHGFEIPDFKVREIVDDNVKTVNFVANKAGIFPINCHLHPAHLGGQLIVLE